MVHKVHISMVLDRSGSMEEARAGAVSAVNRYLGHVRDDASMEARLSIVAFDSEGIDAIRDRLPAVACRDISPAEYQPRGATPLFDAIGYSVAIADCLTGKDERRILAIVTDGLENASREYTPAHLKTLLERKQREDGWLIMYLGAGHDSFTQAGQIGISPRHTAGFSPNALKDAAGVLAAAGRRFLAEPKRVYSAIGGLTADERLRLIDGGRGSIRGLDRRARGLARPAYGR